MSHPQRLLEVTINSAHDLPPMAKMLRTFVVAWVNPDTKLSTRVDHHGHINPTWNDKLLFRVDDDFLRSESSSVMMVIYNLAWLRDLPMGTTNLNIGQILKNLSHKNNALRNISLPIKRSTGHIQGSLNVSVNIVGCPLPTSIPSREVNQPKQESSLEKFDDLEFESKLGEENKLIKPKQETLCEMFDHLELERKIRQPRKEPLSEETLSEETSSELFPVELERNIGVENTSRRPKHKTSPEKSLSDAFDTLDLESKLEVMKNKSSQKKISRKTISATNSMRDSYNGDISSSADSAMWLQPSETGTKTKTKTISSNDSSHSETKRLPLDMKKRCYSHSAGSSTSDNLFENWTEAASSERNTWLSVTPTRGLDHQRNNMLVTANIGEHLKPKSKSKPKLKPRKNSSKEKGLLSCFANLNGFQFKILCGSKNGKKKKPTNSDDPIFTTTDHNLHRFQF